METQLSAQPVMRLRRWSDGRLQAAIVIQADLLKQYLGPNGHGGVVLAYDFPPDQIQDLISGDRSEIEIRPST